MRVLSELQLGDVVEVDVPNLGDFDRVVCDEPVPGFLRKVALSADGVTIHRGREAAVRIPLAELMKIAEAAQPALRPVVR